MLPPPSPPYKGGGLTKGDPMMRYAKILCVLLPFVMCSCLEMSQKIFVNKDGGGTIVERVMMSKAGIKQLQDIFGSFASGTGSKPKPLDFYDKKKLIAEAEKYGPGVNYVTSKKASTDTKEGYEVTYAFQDITTLRINQNPGGKGPATADSKPATQEENITFLFEKGTPAKLTVVFPPPAKVKKEKKAKKEKVDMRDAATQQKANDELRDALSDFYVGITVQPKGKIVDTNATYNDNGTVTLLEMDFKTLISDEKQFEEFAKKEPQTIEETKAMLKNLHGFKVELNPQVTIIFE